MLEMSCGTAEVRRFSEAAAIASNKGLLLTPRLELAQEILTRSGTSQCVIVRREDAESESSSVWFGNKRPANAHAVPDRTVGRHERRRRRAAAAIADSNGSKRHGRTETDHAILDSRCKAKCAGSVRSRSAEDDRDARSGLGATARAENDQAELEMPRPLNSERLRSAAAEIASPQGKLLHARHAADHAVC